MSALAALLAWLCDDPGRGGQSAPLDGTFIAIVRSATDELAAAGCAADGTAQTHSASRGGTPLHPRSFVASLFAADGVDALLLCAYSSGVDGGVRDAVLALLAAVGALPFTVDILGRTKWVLGSPAVAVSALADCYERLGANQERSEYRVTYVMAAGCQWGLGSIDSCVSGRLGHTPLPLVVCFRLAT